MNQYNVREVEIQNIIEQRQTASEQQQQWSYKQLTKTVMMAPRFKYQNVEMSHRMEFVEDVKSIIFDQKSNVQDANFFTRFTLAPFEQKKLENPQIVLPNTKLKKKGGPTPQIDLYYGKFQMEGNIMAKNNQIHYTLYHYNLRSNTIFFYPGKQDELQKCEKQLYHMELNQRTFDYINFNTDYFMLRSDSRNVRIKRDQLSVELIKTLQKKLLVFSFRGAFALRDQVPPWQMQDYFEGQIDKIGPINFEKQNHIKNIVNTKYYKQSTGAFFTLLKRFSQGRNNISGQILIPRWLKNEIKDLPRIQISLVTNLVPTNFSLHSLKIKLEPFQIQTLISSLKSIFPFYKNYLKRTFIVYDSDLTDQNVNTILNQLSYPMYMIGFPNNALSIDSLQRCIESASNLYEQVIDFSYNTKLTSVGQSRLFNLINTNPSIKKLILKGCYVQQGQQGQFFQALTNNLCLSQLELDFLDHYGNSCVEFVRNYAAHIY